MITKAIQKQFDVAKERKWDRVYWAIDLHATLIKPNYRDNDLTLDYYPQALETMQYLSERSDCTLIMYTCSWPNEICIYKDRFSEDGIKFDYINKNPEVDHTGYGYYIDKPYFNILVDDKAGFDPSQWKDIMKLMKNVPLLEGAPAELPESIK